MEKITITTENLITTAQIATAVTMLSDSATSIDRFAKQFLTRCESDGILTPQVRKHALDAFNDLKRELLETLRTITTD
jgi:hypothetical protein